MFLSELITETRVVGGYDVSSKKRLLESLGELLSSSAEQVPADSDSADDAASEGLTPERVFDCLLERERLGSTGLGQGVALPHARSPAVEAPVGAFVQLSAPVNFDSIDDQPVDLAFGLLVPEAATEQHLQLLSGLARLFDNPEFRQRLRDAKSSQAVFGILAASRLELTPT